MFIVRTLRSALLMTGLAIAAFGVIGLAAPGVAQARISKVVCNSDGCSIVYIPTWICDPHGCYLF